MATNPIAPQSIVPVNVTTTAGPVGQPQAPQPQTGPTARTTTTSTTQPRAANLPLMQTLTPPPPQVRAEARLQAYYPVALTQGLDARGQYHVNELMASGPRQWRDMQYAQHPTHTALQFTMWTSTQDRLDVNLRVEHGQIVGLNIANRDTAETVNARCQATMSALGAAQQPGLQLRFAVDVPLPPELRQGLSIADQRLVDEVLTTPESRRNVLRYIASATQTPGQQQRASAAVHQCGGRRGQHAGDAAGPDRFEPGAASASRFAADLAFRRAGFRQSDGARVHRVHRRDALTSGRRAHARAGSRRGAVAA